MHHTVNKNAVTIIEWNLGGHHETYLKHYAHAFLKNGHPVIVLCKKPKELTTWIKSSSGAASENFIAIELPHKAYEGRRKTIRKLADWTTRRKIKKAIKRGESKLHVDCDWVHFGCFYEHESKFLYRLIQTLNLPWTSLYLHPNCFYERPQKLTNMSRRSARVKKLLHDTRLKGLLVLDESIAPKIKHHCKCPVILAPDFSDCDLPQKAEKTPRTLPTSRKPLLKIGLLGHLLPSKGAIPISELILQHRLPNHVLILAGDLPWERYDSHQQEILQKIQQCESAHTQFERIKDETDYNALMNECDVILATYKDFRHSSNTLTKAAAFNIPVIVNDGHLMADRVRKYRLGEVTSSSDLESLRDAILEITIDKSDWVKKHSPRWSDYRKKHSIKRLSESVKKLALPQNDTPHTKQLTRNSNF